ncbi:MAG: 30S ribosomal protein THX [Bacteroidales bacterium]|nr:30S ribosomal protein THX [Bacteroidales bacterium]
MGKGDKKSKRGKIVNKSYGVRRKRKEEAFKADVKKADKPASEKIEKLVEVEAKPKTATKTKPKTETKPKSTPKAQAKADSEE